MTTLYGRHDERTRELLEHSQDIIERSNKVMKDFETLASRVREICSELDDFRRRQAVVTRFEEVDG